MGRRSIISRSCVRPSGTAGWSIAPGGDTRISFLIRWSALEVPAPPDFRRAICAAYFVRRSRGTPGASTGSTGVPARKRRAQRGTRLRCVTDEDFGRFLAIHADITCARAVLTPGNVTGEIDRVLTTVRDQHLPGYLLIPADVVDASAEKALAPL
jgi:hypothetical protein